MIKIKIEYMHFVINTKQMCIYIMYCRTGTLSIQLIIYYMHLTMKKKNIQRLKRNTSPLFWDSLFI